MDAAGPLGGLDEPTGDRSAATVQFAGGPSAFVGAVMGFDGGKEIQDAADHGSFRLRRKPAIQSLHVNFVNHLGEDEKNLH